MKRLTLAAFLAVAAVPAVALAAIPAMAQAPATPTKRHTFALIIFSCVSCES
jgi:hypothetical protein